MLSASQWVALNKIQFCGGLIGPTGKTGNQGPSGPTGASGPTGPIGNIGNSGLAGSIGASANGFGGTRGSTGTVGDIGIGANGTMIVGVTGPRGPTGPSGPTGPTGPSGPSVPGTILVATDLTAGGPSASGNGIPAISGSPTYVYSFPNFVENNSQYAGIYKFIAYVYRPDYGYRDASTSVCYFDFVIFPKVNNTVSYLPIATMLGTASMQLYQNTLFVGFVARVTPVDPYLYKWELRKLSITFT